MKDMNGKKIPNEVDALIVNCPDPKGLAYLDIKATNLLEFQGRNAAPKNTKQEEFIPIWGTVVNGIF